MDLNLYFRNIYTNVHLILPLFCELFSLRIVIIFMLSHPYLPSSSLFLSLCSFSFCYFLKPIPFVSGYTFIHVCFPFWGSKEKFTSVKCVSHLVVSNSLRPRGLQTARLLCPWNSPGKNTGVGSHFLLQGIFPT